MEMAGERVHTTLNLSSRLMREAQRLFKDRSKTEIIHEALERLIRTEKLEAHFKKYKGQGSFHAHE